MKICYLDIDETLIYSRTEVPGSINFHYNGENELSYTLARPSAKAFLEALKAKGYQLDVVTQGLVQFQRHCLQLLDLDQYIKEYYGYLDPHDLNQINTPVYEEKSVLVDNLHWKELGLKMSWFKYRPTLIHCTDFYGLEDEDMSLMKLLPSIEEILG